MREWKVIGGAVLAGILLMFGLSYLQYPVYRATALAMFVPAETDTAAASNLFGDLRSLAGMVGVGGASTEFDRSVAVLRSQSLCRIFLAEANRVEILEAEWRRTHRLSAALGIASPPATENARCRYLSEDILQLDVDPRTNFIRVSMTMSDRELSAEWANEFIRQADAKLRTDALEQAQANLVYLEREYREAATVGLQQAVARAMEARIRVKALAASRPSYTLDIIDRAVPSDPGFFAAPRRVLLALAGGFLAGFLTLLWIARKYSWRASLGTSQPRG